jgi:hypothetical protein
VNQETKRPDTVAAMIEKAEREAEKLAERVLAQRLKLSGRRRET